MSKPPKQNQKGIQIAYLADHAEFVPQIAAWYFAEWGRRVPGNSVEQTCSRLNAKLNRARVPIPIVALADRELLGTAQLKIREMECFPEYEFWLGGVYVASRARGRGIGELLVERIEEISRQLGIRKLYLQTEMPGGGLYTRLGWQPLEQADAQGTRISVMRKEFHRKDT